MHLITVVPWAPLGAIGNRKYACHVTSRKPEIVNYGVKVPRGCQIRGCGLHLPDRHLHKTHTGGLREGSPDTLDNKMRRF